MGYVSTFSCPLTQKLSRAGLKSNTRLDGAGNPSWIASKQPLVLSIPTPTNMYSFCPRAQALEHCRLSLLQLDRRFLGSKEMNAFLRREALRMTFLHLPACLRKCLHLLEHTCPAPRKDKPKPSQPESLAGRWPELRRREMERDKRMETGRHVVVCVHCGLDATDLKFRLIMKTARRNERVC